MRKPKMSLVLILSAICGLFFAVLSFNVSSSLLQGNTVPESNASIRDNSQNRIQEIFKKDDVSPTPTPPFFEMTIPYLRSRTYESRIIDQQLVSQNQNFSSYLATYDSDGLKVNGLLTIPRGEEPEEGWPAIVFIHGYIPPTVYNTTENYQSYANYYANRDFVVFKIDLRGHAQSEGEANGAYYSSDYIIDTLNARAALQSTDYVNPDGIGLWGHSMGGNVVFRSLVAARDIPAAVIWAGAVYSYEDWQAYQIDDNSYRPPADDSERRRRREDLFNTHGQFDTNSPFWQQVVPTNYLDGVRANIQIHHARNDNVVSIEYSRNLMNILEGSSFEYELVEYGSGGHNLTGTTFNTAMQRSADFFDEMLRN